MNIAKPPLAELACRFHYQDSEILADPWPLYARLRNECPVAHSDRFGGFWLLSRYEDIHAAAQDTATYSSAQGVIIPPVGLPLPLIPFEADPPRHTDFRRLLMRQFAPEAVAALEPYAVEQADLLMGAFDATRPIDLVNDYALPLTSAVFGQLLSLPQTDRPRVAGWTNAIMGRAANPAAAADAVAALLKYLDALVRQRRADPGSDILGALLTTPAGGQALTHDEVVAMCFTFVLAGLETTIVAMGGSLQFLANHPRLRERLLSDDALFKPFVEEYLRMEPPAQAHVRTLTRDVVLHGRTLRAGEKVMLLWSAANRDERQFPEPDRFVADRHPNRHFTFGVGRHRCIGAHLASMEIRVAAMQLAARFPHYRIVDAAGVRNFETARGPRVLPVVLQ